MARSALALQNKKDVTTPTDSHSGYDYQKNETLNTLRKRVRSTLHIREDVANPADIQCNKHKTQERQPESARASQGQPKPARASQCQSQSQSQSQSWPELARARAPDPARASQG